MTIILNKEKKREAEGRDARLPGSCLKLPGP